jgi:hypothetical protein
MNRSAELRLASRHIPDNAIPLEHPQGLGIAYVYRIGDTKYGARVFRGTAAKPDWHYSFKTIEQAIDYIEEWLKGLTEHSQRVKTYRKQSFEPHTFKTGDVATNSWGYDQTNVDWYKVVKTSEHFVWLQPICGHTEETGFMSGRSEPQMDVSADDPSKWGFREAKGRIERHKAYGSNVCMKYGSGSKWNGETRYASWYA